MRSTLTYRNALTDTSALWHPPTSWTALSRVRCCVLRVAREERPEVKTPPCCHPAAQRWKRPSATRSTRSKTRWHSAWSPQKSRWRVDARYFAPEMTCSAPPHPRRVKAAAALYVDNQLQALEDVRQGTATVQHKLQRLNLALQAQLNVDDG